MGSDTVVQNGGKNETLLNPQLQQQLQQHVPPHHNSYYAGLDKFGPSSPGVMIASPASASNQPVLHPQVATCHHNYDQSSATMKNYVPYSSPSQYIHTADPASPMQTATYPPQRCFQPEGAMQPVPTPPPPNYTEATAMAGDMQYHGHLPPNYDSIVVGSEYPSHLPATLPKNHQ